MKFKMGDKIWSPNQEADYLFSMVMNAGSVAYKIRHYYHNDKKDVYGDVSKIDAVFVFYEEKKAPLSAYEWFEIKLNKQQVKQVELEECPTCDGLGEVHSHNPRCWDCDGKGKVTKEEAKNIRRAMFFSHGKIYV